MSLKTLKTLSRSSILSNFLARESLSTTITNPIDFESSSGSNPFSHTKVEGAKSYNPPRYSIRRQKKLQKLTLEAGLPLSILPIAPVQIKVVRPSRIFNSVAHIPKTSVLQGLDLVRTGPYTGRKVAFKGKVWERKKSERVEELRVALAGADLKEKIWRQVSSNLY